MKTTSRLNPRNILLGGFLLLGLVSWSPPTGDNISVTSGDVLIRNGVLDLRVNSHADNVFGDYPAVIVGTANNTNMPTVGRGLVVGASNQMGNQGGYGAIIGNSNQTASCNSIIVGNSNNVTKDAATLVEGNRYSAVIGHSNVITGPSSAILVSGTSNTVAAHHSLVSGYTNSVEGPTVGSPSYYSAAIGQLNHVSATSGWTMGYGNTVTGNKGVAIGTQLNAPNSQSIALGQFNATMQTNDVLVVGTGTDTDNRNTALRVTSDGGVILGRAQGEISMGDYQ